MTLPVIIIGAGGHAKVVIDMLKRNGVKILGAVDVDPNRHGQTIIGVPVLGGDNEVMSYESDTVCLANGIGSTMDTSLRRKVFERFKEQGYSFITVFHPSAVVAEDVQVGEGSQIMAGAVVQPGTQIGANCIINTRSSVDHDCAIGDHVHIAPGVVLSGTVTIGKSVHIGTSATIIQNVKIGRECHIYSGAVVVDNIDNNARVAGIPAREK